MLAIKVLDDSNELSSLHGRGVLNILILQEIIAIALLVTPWILVLLLLPLLRPLAHRLLTVSRAGELRLLLGVSLTLAGGVLAESVGVSSDIGALLTGVMLASHPQTDDLSDKLWRLKEVFLVAFFLQIGLTDLPTLEQALTALGLILLLPLQGGLFFVFFVLAGLRARAAFVSSLALMTYSEFALITTGAVVNALLPEEWTSIISLAVAGSLAVAAPLNRLFSWTEPVLIRFERKSGHPDRLPESFGASEWLVVGMGRTGVSAYLALQAEEKRVVGLDADPTVLEDRLAEGRRVVYGDAEDTELWGRLPLERIKGVILTMPEFEVRCAAISQLRKRRFTGRIGTICYYSGEERELTRLGANLIIHPLIEAGSQLARQIMDKDG